MHGRTLADFDARANSLNFLRLMLAVSVIVWHCFPLGGFDSGPGQGRLGDIGVDGFFVISGFLITASWMTHPRLGRFLAHRALRILPAFWVCLLVTGLVIAPLAWWHQHNTLSSYNIGGAIDYFASNWTLAIHELRINDTPSGVPFPNAWNGSLYTLAWEALCYLVIAVLGMLTILKRWRIVMVAIFAACWFVAAGQRLVPQDFSWSFHIGSVTISTFVWRFGMTFSVGSVAYLYRDRVPIQVSVASVAALLVAAGLVTDSYRLLALLPFAYLILYFGMALPAFTQRIGARNDFSYGLYIYAFPVQQLLATFNAHRFGYVAYLALSLLATAPLAVASWFIIERPALRLKRRFS